MNEAKLTGLPASPETEAAVKALEAQIPQLVGFSFLLCWMFFCGL